MQENLKSQVNMVDVPTNVIFDHFGPQNGQELVQVDQGTTDFVKFNLHHFFEQKCTRVFPEQFLTAPSGVQLSIYTASAKREFDGTGWTGWTGRTEYQKCPSIFFILCGYIGKVYT